jgi:tetratricopeptide (TPR) repeat protein
MESAALLPSEHRKDSPSLYIHEENNPLQALTGLCALVASGERPYEDVAEQIEDKAYELCEAGRLDLVVEQLCGVADFFEKFTGKNDEQCRDLADVYLLIGQIHQFAGQFFESIAWFTRAAIVDDRYPAPFHSLATSYRHLHEYDSAIKSLEHEIKLAPGNYYSYLLLADIYEEEDRSDDAERCLKRLLERDHENLQGLHRLIRYYEHSDAAISTSLLKRRLMGVNKEFNRIEAVIRAYYFCREGKFAEAIEFIDNWNKRSNGVTIMLLVKAYVFSEMRLYARRRKALAEFKMQNHGRSEVMMTKLREFASVFGDGAAEALHRQLMLSSREK